MGGPGGTGAGPLSAAEKDAGETLLRNNSEEALHTLNGLGLLRALSGPLSAAEALHNPNCPGLLRALPGGFL